MAKLVVREGRNVGAEYVFPPDKRRVVLGRRSSNEIQVLDPKASREHAEVMVEEGRYVLRDLKSRNRTILNDDPVTVDQDIEFGDRIRIGDAVYEFVDETKDEPITLEIPAYDILERIGRGGMGTVYKARQLSMDRIVALKVLNEKHSKDEQFIRRFIREARAAGRLSHPNVIHVHDVSDHKGTHYFTMEYVDGTTVKKLLKRQGRIDLDKSLDILLQAAKALEYAHENTIVHRDIKPDNLMLTRDGVVKLADLGIAKLFDDSVEDGGPSRRVLGTPHYMAPEQALGRDIDARADVYSLGATFYHMLTGTTPFQGGTITDVLKAHIQDSLRPVRERAPEVPESVVRIVERMMAKDPDKRYASMGALSEDVEKVIADREANIERLDSGESSVLPSAEKRPAEKRKRGAKEQEEKAPGRSRGLVLAGVAVGLIVLFALTVLIVQALFKPEGTPEEAFSAIESAVEAGQHSEARRLIGEFLLEYPDAPEAERARQIRSDLGAEGDDGLGEELARELGRIEELEKSGGLERALAGAGNFLDRRPPPALANRARKLIEGIEATLKSRKAAEAEKQFADAAAWADANPADRAGQIERFRVVADSFAGTPAGERAEGRVRHVSRLLRTAKGNVARTEFDQVRRTALDARDKSDFDAAIQAYKGFIAQHGDSEQAVEAGSEVKSLEKEIADTFKRAKASAERQLARGLFGQARATVERFCQQYVSQQWVPEARKLSAEVEKRIDEAFEKESAKARASALEFSYDDAAGQYNLLAARFRKTRWENIARSRVQRIKTEKALHAELVRRMNAESASGPRELPFVPPGVPETMKATKWFVRSASERNITLFPRRQEQFLRPVRWGELPPENLIDLIEVYFPKATTEEHLAIADLCQERDLEERAQMHREMAAGAPRE